MERDEWVEETSEPVSIIPTATGAGPATTAAITVRDIRRSPEAAANPTTGAIPREKRQWLWLALAGAVLFGLVLGAWRWLGAPEPIALPVVTASAARAGAIISAPTPIPEAITVPSESASAPAPAVRTPKAQKLVPVKNCDPPYTEKDGIRYPKPGCL